MACHHNNTHFKLCDQQKGCVWIYTSAADLSDGIQYCAQSPFIQIIKVWHNMDKLIHCIYNAPGPYLKLLNLQNTYIIKIRNQEQS